MSSKKYIPIFIINAFTTGQNDPHTGGPAAVCFLNYDDDISDEKKQQIAFDLNLSETVFLSHDWSQSTTCGATVQNSDLTSSTVHRKIRWFTPLKEIALCGHATLASVYALIMTSNSPLTSVTFDSRYGLHLTTLIENDGKDYLITLDFPSYPPKIIPQTSLTWLAPLASILLGPKFENGGDAASHVEDVFFCDSLKYLVLRLRKQGGVEGKERITNVQPNYAALKKAETGDLGANVFIVTIEGDKKGGKDASGRKPDFYTRVFAPYFGVTEDPVCGSAHAVLMPYWAEKLGMARKELWAHEPSPRGGDLYCCLTGDDNDRVTLKGRARVFIKGEIEL